MLSSGPLRQCVFMPLVMRKVNMKINRKCLVASAVAVVMILFILLELAKLLKFSSLGGLQSHLITLFFWTTIVSVFACLIHKIDRLELSLKSNIPSREVATKLNYLVVNWFMNHIKAEDKKLCKYLLTEVDDSNQKLLGRLKQIVKGFFKSKG